MAASVDAVPDAERQAAAFELKRCPFLKKSLDVWDAGILAVVRSLLESCRLFFFSLLSIPVISFVIY